MPVSLTNTQRSVSAVICVAALLSCTPRNEIELVGDPSPYLLMFAGDLDIADSDFLVVIDANPESNTLGEPLSSLPTGMTDSLPHHMEYSAPPPGEPLFMNAHNAEQSLIVDVSTLPDLALKGSFAPPSPFRFPHDYTRTPGGTRLVGFMRSDGPSPDEGEDLVPGNHGGIAEYSMSGELLRSTEKAIRPYAFAMVPQMDRFVVTSAPMLEDSWAQVLQIYSYSDFELLKTLEIPGRALNGAMPKTYEPKQAGLLAGLFGAAKEEEPQYICRAGSTATQEPQRSGATGFGIRTLDDGSVFMNTYECSFYHLSDINAENPALDPAASCGIPVLAGQFWIQPVARNNSVVVLDIADPKRPVEVFRLKTPGDFKPHWLSKDPHSNRLILGAEFGGEVGFYVLRFDQTTGAVEFDGDFQGRKPGRFFSTKTRGYISLKRETWPHGPTGDAWGHAALFLSGPSNQ